MVMTVYGIDVDPEWLLHRAIYTVLIILGSYVILHWYGKAINHLLSFLGSRRTISHGYGIVFKRITTWFLWLLVWVVVLRVWAVDVTAICTTFVSLLAVIGVGMLALWAMVSNITARFFIWFWQPLRLGQRIEIFPEALIGEVVEENLMFTELKQDDGAVVVIPNNFFFQRVIRRLPDVGDKKESE
ncbi:MULTISPECIES: mechanosensitive ion channel domain-containing protein [Acidithiobacillus]|uniref:Small-conductance mechanosensitive channel n=1 Tax=Acidithiobacillus thiooxidans ATCC 19377 TaxID=637390 RepID=A0A5P9XPB8_ACITH|nr:MULTISPECIES: mechanosensitive ion channel domain-containing protein [Acidithiobacillus]MBU2740983.1 mechanosensitive ion channel family protein [Acidithiobacillus albertensis]MDA8177030.1 mechanosensitive ion channel [Acidithiobacillus sp.]QFX95742.1 mechanosensitive ion channel protein MscS [Acidithiobacillus thiooxidans ATCC 19377]